MEYGILWNNELWRHRESDAEAEGWFADVIYAIGKKTPLHGAFDLFRKCGCCGEYAVPLTYRSTFYGCLKCSDYHNWVYYDLNMGIRVLGMVRGAWRVISYHQYPEDAHVSLGVYRAAHGGLCEAFRIEVFCMWHGWQSTSMGECAQCDYDTAYAVDEDLRLEPEAEFLGEPPAFYEANPFYSNPGVRHG